MPRPPEGAVRSTLLGAIALAATLAVLTGTVRAAGDPLARAWQSAFGERARPAAQEQRVLVLLAAPSLADRLAGAGAETSPREQRRWTAEAEGAQRLLLAGLRERSVAIRRERVFTRTINGFSAVVGPRALAELERAAGVAGIYPVRAVYPASPSKEALSGFEFRTGEGRRPELALPGFDGSGVMIALLDTGVDRRHPYLRGRVLRGFDLVDGDRDAAPAPKPDEPSTLEGHGTRMAGLLVGREGPAGLDGVAPGARVLPIRVLGWQEAQGGGYALLGRGDVLLAGLERAVDPNRNGDVEDAADVLLAAVVEPFAAFPDSPEARAVAGASRLGTLVVAPTGNDGPSGAGFGTVGAPAGAAEALAVGALDARRSVLETQARLAVDGDEALTEPARILGAYVPAERLDLTVTALFGPTLAEPGRAAGAEASGIDLGDFFDTEGVSVVAGKAVLLTADGSSLAQRARNAAAAGAAALLVRGTELPAGALDLDDGAPLPVVVLPGAAGSEAAAALRGGETVSVALEPARPVRNGALLDVAGFSSGGLAFDGRVKPDLVAPGVGLATSDPGRSADGGARYATATGTSAAAALAAGAAALVAQARPDLSASALRSALVGSAARLARGDAALPVTSQGAGLLDPARAAVSELVVEPATLAFGRADGPGWSAARPLTVTNVSSRRLSVGFGVAPDGENGSQLSFSAQPTRLALAPGASAEVSIGVSADGEPPASAGGALVVEAEGAPSVRVPWALARRAFDRGPLVGDVELSHSEFAPAKSAPAVLAFRAGRVDRNAEGETVEPAGVLEVELWTAAGKRLGVLARLRDVLPGRYAFGLTGRGPQGRLLREGTYVLRLRAYPVDGDDGARPSTAEAVFRIIRH